MFPAKVHVQRSTLHLVLVLAAFLAGTSAGQVEAGSTDRSRLIFTNWRATAYSHRAGGTVCWLEGQDGSLRLEIRQGPEGFSSPRASGVDGLPKDLAPLFEQTGEGWTLVLGPDDTGTLNAWGQEWRRPPYGLVQLARLVTAALTHHPDPVPGNVPARAFPVKQDVGSIPAPAVIRPDGGSPAPEPVRRYQLGNLGSLEVQPTAGAGFRGRMTTRGLGGGGDQEVVVLDWGGGPGGSSGGLKVSSSRRPGTLELEVPRSHEVAAPEPEFFLPMWPMARFF